MPWVPCRGAAPLPCRLPGTRPRSGCSSSSPIPASGSRTGTRSGSSNLTAPPSGGAPAWVWPSSTPSWPSTRAFSGWKTTCPRAPNLSSTFPCIGPIMPGPLLVVDDEPQILQMISGILQDEGFEVITAPDGEAALKLVGEEAPDLVLLDIALPGLDGLEVLQELKRLYPFLPVVIISAYGSGGNAVKGTRLGAHDFIEKPPHADKNLPAGRNGLDVC